MGKTVLILGNGFDLAHDLPTRYSDFLKFCKVTELLYECHNYHEKTFSFNFDDCIKYMSESKIHSKIKEVFLEIFSEQIDVFSTTNKILRKRYLLIKELYSYIGDNIWFHYFWNIYNNNLNIGENWIDFEEEIGRVLQTLNVRTNKMDFTFNDVIKYFNRSTFQSNDDGKKFGVFRDIINKNKFILATMNELSSRLYKDLNNLIFALEIYLSEFVNKMDISLISTDIKDINPDYIVNFNYTNTYQRLYANKQHNTNLCHIHGFCRDWQYRSDFKSNSMLDNNMVLGCGEYSVDNKDEYLNNFDLFKKYIQRIEKDTLMKSDEYFDIIKRDYEINNEVAQVFIFGHSLGEIDNDVLQDYIDNPATKLTIFCKDKNAISTYMKRIRSIIDSKQFYEMTNVRPRKLIFKVQQPMVPVEKKKKELLISGAAP